MWRKKTPLPQSTRRSNGVLGEVGGGRDGEEWMNSKCILEQV